MRYGLYEILKPLFAAMLLQQFGIESRLFSFIIAGAVAELFGSTALSPFETARIRLVAVPGFANGVQEAISKLIRTEGVYNQ